MKALTAGQIIDILEQDKHTRKIFKGVCARNISVRPPLKIKSFPAAYILNTGYLQQGLHWVLVVFTQKLTIFFDSFGRSPTTLLLESSTRRENKPILYNSARLQHSKSEVCGHWVIYYLYFLCQNNTISQINTHFSKNTRHNDKIVFNFVKKLGKQWTVPIL